MRRRSFIGALAFSLTAVGCVAAQPPAAGGAHGNTAATPDPTAAVAEFVALMDEARRAAGCGAPLVRDEAVVAVALAHSQDMVRRDFFDHVNPDGLTPMQRVQASRIPVRAVAENIALGQPTGRAVFDSWRDSAGHRRNMLNCEYTHHGVGLAGVAWTHVLVRRP